MFKRTISAFGLVLALLLPASAFAQTADDARTFDNGFTVQDDAVWGFYSQHGGQAAFGAPISREFTLGDTSTQLFEQAALQVQADGSVTVMPLATLLPYTRFDGLTV